MLPGSVLPRHCSACGADLTLHERYAGGVCSDIDCRRKRVDARVRAAKADLMQLRDLRAADAGVPDPHSIPVIALSWYQQGLGPVPQSQRHGLRQHLMTMQAEVDTGLATATAVDPDLLAADLSATVPPASVAVDDPLLGSVCARCTGFCCRHGNGRHAFLDAPALLRARLAQPGATHADVVAGYLDDIPEQHHLQSCAYHGAQGCVLPRHRRSDLCNSWECPPLAEARHHIQAGGGRTLFVVRGRRDQPSFAADFLTVPATSRN